MISLIIIQQIYNQINLDNKNYPPLQKHIALNHFITTHSSPDDLVMLPTDQTGLKLQAAGYYYFGPQDVIQTMHNIFPYKNLPAKDEIILNNKPKIIYLDYTPSSKVLTLLDKYYYRVRISPVTLFVRYF